MTNNKFLKIMELYYNITSGKPQIESCPDINISISSISWSIRIEIFINGYEPNKNPDYIYCINNETDDAYIDQVIDMLQFCKYIKGIYLKYVPKNF